MPNIEELSKTELLGIIYNYIPDTLFFKHPCYCVGCGKDYSGDLVDVHFKEGETRTVEPYIYMWRMW